MNHLNTEGPDLITIYLVILLIDNIPRIDANSSYGKSTTCKCKKQKGSGRLCKSLPSIQKLRILCTILVLKIHRIYENAHDFLGMRRSF